MRYQEIDELATSPINICRSLEERLNGYYKTSSHLFERIQLPIDPIATRAAEFLYRLLQCAEPGPKFPTRERAEAHLEAFRAQNADFTESWDSLVSQGWIRCFYSSWNLPISSTLRLKGDTNVSLLQGFLTQLDSEFVSYKQRLQRYPRVKKADYERISIALSIDPMEVPKGDVLTNLGDSYVISLIHFESKSLISWIFARLWDDKETATKYANLETRFDWWISLVICAEIYPSSVPYFLREPEQLIQTSIDRLLNEEDIGNCEFEKRKAAAVLAAEYNAKDILSYYNQACQEIKNQPLVVFSDYVDKSFVWDRQTTWLMDYYDDAEKRTGHIATAYMCIFDWLLVKQWRGTGQNFTLSWIERILDEGKTRPRLIELFIDRCLSGWDGQPSVLPYLLVNRCRPNVIGLALTIIAKQQSIHFAILKPRFGNASEHPEIFSIHTSLWTDAVKIALATLIEQPPPGGPIFDMDAHHREAAQQILGVYVQLAGEARPTQNSGQSSLRPLWMEERLEIFLKLLDSWPNPLDRGQAVLTRLLSMLVSAIRARLEHAASQSGNLLHRPELGLILWLLRRPCLSAAITGWTDAAQFVSDEYGRIRDPGYHAGFPADLGWIYAMRWLASNQSDRFDSIVRLRDFGTEIRSMGAEDRLSAQGHQENSIRGHLRLHLRFLAFLIENWEQGQRIPCEVTSRQVLITAFSDLLCIFSIEDKCNGTLDIFRIIVGLDADESHGMKPLMDDVGHAISSIPHNQQTELIQRYIGITQEPRRLGQLYNALSDSESRRLVRDRLIKFSAHADIVSLKNPRDIEIISLVNALIEADMPEHAEGYLIRHNEKMSQLWPGRWEIEYLRLKLRCEAVRGNWDFLESQSLPADLSHNSEAKAVFEFYHAVALMRKIPGDYIEAANVFHRLWSHNPHEISYAINWIAARIAAVTNFPENSAQSQEKFLKMNEVLIDAEALMAEQSIIKTEEFCRNYLFLLRRMKYWDKLERFFYSLPSSWRARPAFIENTQEGIKGNDQGNYQPRPFLPENNHASISSVRTLSDGHTGSQDTALAPNPSPGAATTSGTPEAEAPEAPRASPPTQSVATTVRPGASRSRLPESLITAVRRRKLIAFAGAGVSMAVLDRENQVDGQPARLFPSWRELLERAADKLRGETLDGDADYVLGALNKTNPDYLTAAQTAKDHLGAIWSIFLKSNFSLRQERAVPESLSLARALWQLGNQLIITTNYDRVLRWTCPQSAQLCELTNQSTAELQSIISSGAAEPTIWHLHGSIDNTAQIILTPDGYSRLYPQSQDSGSAEYEAALQSLRMLLASHSLLFVGFSFADSQFSDQLRWIQHVFQGAAGPHFLLVRQADIDNTRLRVASAGLSLTLVPYAGHGQPLLDLLADLAREVT